MEQNCLPVQVCCEVKAEWAQVVILSKLGISFLGCKDRADSAAELKTPVGVILTFQWRWVGANWLSAEIPSPLLKDLVQCSKAVVLSSSSYIVLYFRVLPVFHVSPFCLSRANSARDLERSHSPEYTLGKAVVPQQPLLLSGMMQRGVSCKAGRALQFFSLTDLLSHDPTLWTQYHWVPVTTSANLLVQINTSAKGITQLGVPVTTTYNFQLEIHPCAKICGGSSS